MHHLFAYINKYLGFAVLEKELTTLYTPGKRSPIELCAQVEKFL